MNYYQKFEMIFRRPVLLVIVRLNLVRLLGAAQECLWSGHLEIRLRVPSLRSDHLWVGHALGGGRGGIRCW